MKKYLGVKLIEAEPAVEGGFEKAGLHGGAIARDGYRVIYPDGYVSWSPKDTFEKAYRPIDGLTFGLAIEAMKMGLKVARKGWNGKGMFIFIRPADEIHIDFVVNKMKSLPKSVKDYFHQDCIDDNGNDLKLGEDETVKFTAYICMKAADGTIVNGWLASQTDMLAEDWEIVE